METHALVPFIILFRSRRKKKKKGGGDFLSLCSRTNPEGGEKRGKKGKKGKIFYFITEGGGKRKGGEEGGGKRRVPPSLNSCWTARKGRERGGKEKDRGDPYNFLKNLRCSADSIKKERKREKKKDG